MLGAAYAPLRLPLAEVAVQGVVIGHVGYRRRKPLRDAVCQSTATGNIAGDEEIV